MQNSLQAKSYETPRIQLEILKSGKAWIDMVLYLGPYSKEVIQFPVSICHLKMLYIFKEFKKLSER